VDAKYIAHATLVDLARAGAIDASVPQKAIGELGINPEKPNPAIS
jgi:pyruvate dehydrogenase complex dehydrogenase (E1) component